jgi:hypothetical protein
VTVKLAGSEGIGETRRYCDGVANAKQRSTLSSASQHLGPDLLQSSDLIAPKAVGGVGCKGDDALLLLVDKTARCGSATPRQTVLSCR